jgi:FAD/FMN-containing dehydrogenase
MWHMHRRSVLKGVAAVIAAPSGLLPRLTAAAATASGFRRVRPGDPAWPDAAGWARLKKAVGGNLIAVEPPFGACASDPKGVACAGALENIRNPFYIGDQPGGTQVSGWLDAWTPVPSTYAVRARSSSDVAAAVNFAREHRLRLVVKGAGHSYLGTSNAADSLLIWTRAMNAVTLHDVFVPQGCDATTTAPVPAVSAGAGAVWIDLYHAVTTQAGRYVQGGGCTDVGVAGLIQSGGFGSFSKGFGLAAASLLEAEIVTADGAMRIANACTNPNLFWAIKGGGGGSFGVVTRLTLRTHELPKFFGGVFGTIKARSDEAFRRLIAHALAFYAKSLFNPHWGEQIAVRRDNTLELSMVCQGLDEAQANAAWQPFFDWVKASPDFSLSDGHGAQVMPARSFWDVTKNPFMVPDRRPGAPRHHGWWRSDQDQVGAYLHGYESLWLPASLLQDGERQRLADALFAASRHKKVGLHLNKGLAGAPEAAIAAARDTATNPTVTEAFALAIIADGDGGGPRHAGLTGPAVDAGAAQNNARAIDLAAAELRRVAPDAGSYVSESNYFNTAWQTAYWGPNYPRLRAVKAAYDPDGLFFVHHGVGSEDWSTDGFTRI